MNPNFKRILWLMLAYTCIGLGFVGIFLPLLPTVPFLLLAVYAALRSSPRLAHRLLNHKWLGPPLRDYLENKQVSRILKIRAIAFLWLSLCISILLIHTRWVHLMLLGIGIAVTIHILALRTKK